MYYFVHQSAFAMFKYERARMCTCQHVQRFNPLLHVHTCRVTTDIVVF